MENASKALLIAGGILIAILVLAVVVTVSTSTSKLAQSQDEKKLAEQTAEFNRSFEAYNKKVMYGTDIISVVNKANDYNERVGSNDITIKVLDKDHSSEISISYEKEFKSSVFACTGIDYSNITGRVNFMEFTKQ